MCADAEQAEQIGRECMNYLCVFITCNAVLVAINENDNLDELVVCSYRMNGRKEEKNGMH